MFRIRDNWHTRCGEAGCPLSGSMLSEFKKRIAQASGANSKAKLNLANMNLHDKQVRAVLTYCIIDDFLLSCSPIPSHLN